MAMADRSTQIDLIGEPADRDRWLASELDTVETRFDTALSHLDNKMSRVLWALVGVLISTATTSVTLVITSLAA